jgi:hypothetical protein
VRAKTLRYLNVWSSVSLLYMSNARRICKDKPANQNSAIQGQRRWRISIPWPRSQCRSPDDQRSPPVCRATCCTPPA